MILIYRSVLPSPPPLHVNRDVDNIYLGIGDSPTVDLITQEWTDNTTLYIFGSLLVRQKIIKTKVF